MDSAKILYFKESGKWYESSELELEIHETYDNLQFLDVSKRVEELSRSRNLPGILGDWKNEGHIALTHFLGAVLITKYRSTSKTTYIKTSQQNENEVETNNSVKMFYFYPDGGYAFGEFYLQIEDCLSNDILLTYKVSDKIKELSESRHLPGIDIDLLGEGCFIMIDSPPDHLHGCPHLVVPE